MITLRESLPSDDQFLLHLYGTTRVQEMALVDWSQEQKAEFLSMQFYAQRSSYLLYYPAATYQVIAQEEIAIGRLIVNRDEEKIILMDIALLPAYRNQCIGTHLIQELLNEATHANKTVSLHVEPYNPALRLYQRLGFVPVAEAGFYLEMEWQPPVKTSMQTCTTNNENETAD